MNSQKFSARPLLLLLLAFVLPVVLAKLVLSQHWYNEGATNQGQLFTEETSYQSLGATNPAPQRWQILYLMPQTCDQICKDRLYVMHQSHTALGAERIRVTPLVLVSATSDIKSLDDSALPTASLPTALDPLLASQEFILVDPLGTLVMRYPAVSGQEANISQGKAMLADLRKLLKLSRVG
ncbi:hypothetical protein [Shewanella litorisediminis]|uniref:Transmembrane cytochrome oxidase associated protein n=1 Tax=Shewanella litorisediminis TaxID=1173586 RepID=A0ABX7G317_9GAMM|nr:hypothetical protein [Shewanella litorisediminis]MCL2917227.1 hypothetical protein [Shewanella litorisediminis]QRH01701.1 hypothetical protein JQC75_17950 [Shewanella litorisediminis]